MQEGTSLDSGIGVLDLSQPPVRRGELLLRCSGEGRYDPRRRGAGSGPSRLYGLPDAVFREIIAFLGDITSVVRLLIRTSKIVRALGTTSAALWEQVSTATVFCSRPNQLTQMLSVLSRVGPAMRQLTIAYDKYRELPDGVLSTTAQVTALILICPRVHKLKLSDVIIDSSVYEALMGRLESLEELDISRAVLTSSAIHGLAQGMLAGLSTLTVNSRQLLGLQGHESLLRPPRGRLRCLHVSGGSPFALDEHDDDDEEDEQAGLGGVLRAILLSPNHAQPPSSLEQLCLSRLPYEEAFGWLIHATPMDLPFLKHLRLSDAPFYAGQRVVNRAKDFRSLRRLELFPRGGSIPCNHFIDIIGLVSSCPLEALDLRVLTWPEQLPLGNLLSACVASSTLQELCAPDELLMGDQQGHIQLPPNLRSLVLYRRRPTSDNIHGVMGGRPAVVVAPMLQTLCLEGGCRVRRPLEIQAPRLKTLELKDGVEVAGLVVFGTPRHSGCYASTGDNELPLPSSTAQREGGRTEGQLIVTCSPTLSTVRVGGCLSIARVDVESGLRVASFSRLPNLRSLMLSSPYLSQLDVDGVAALHYLRIKSPALQRLDLSRWALDGGVPIGLPDLERVLLECEGLEHLNLAFCMNLTSVRVDKLHTALRSLNLRSCVRVVNLVFEGQKAAAKRHLADLVLDECVNLRAIKLEPGWSLGHKARRSMEYHKLELLSVIRRE